MLSFTPRNEVSGDGGGERCINAAMLRMWGLKADDFENAEARLTVIISQFRWLIKRNFFDSTHRELIKAVS